MKKIRARFKLPTQAYEALRLQVLARDGWRCQVCGRCSNLEVHHKQFRSRQGSDSEENLITLCNSCHAAIHCSQSKASAHLISVCSSASDPTSSLQWAKASRE
jgi:5-methylcytosine-specific restriction endonuclease McrA